VRRKPKLDVQPRKPHLRRRKSLDFPNVLLSIAHPIAQIPKSALLLLASLLAAPVVVAAAGENEKPRKLLVVLQQLPHQPRRLLHLKRPNQSDEPADTFPQPSVAVKDKTPQREMPQRPGCVLLVTLLVQNHQQTAFQDTLLQYDDQMALPLATSLLRRVILDDLFLLTCEMGGRHLGKVHPRLRLLAPVLARNGSRVSSVVSKVVEESIRPRVEGRKVELCSASLQKCLNS
jgi:hypothetical protein